MNQGFTLIELLVVVLIIGILSAIALPQYQTAVERARATEALTLMSALSESIQRYHAQHDEWPFAALEELGDLLDVDIPEVTSGDDTYYGSKNFEISLVSMNDGFYVKASRLSPHKYILQTNITINSDGTYSTTRQCYVPGNADAEAQNFCYAIAGGADKVNDF